VTIWTGVEPIVCIFKLKTSDLSWGDVKLIWHMLWSNSQLPWHDVNLIYFIIFVCRKPLPANPSKKFTQPAPSLYATPVAPSAGVTGSTALSAVRLETSVSGQLNSWRAWRTETLINRVTRLLLHYFCQRTAQLATFSICSVGYWLEGSAESIVRWEVCPIRSRKFSGWGEGFKVSC
jgi:hypothetical protein